MKKKEHVLWLSLAVGLSLFFANQTAHAEHHRATRLGNPLTRFAPPLHNPDELRERFSDPNLRSDFITVLQLEGWQGNPDDMFRAAQTAEIKNATIPVGSVMPFMSTREKGRPICLRNVTWAGAKPVEAYAFDFTSNGRCYRCIMPKPCSNFFVEDMGPQPKPGLELTCEAPARMPTTRPVKVYLTVSNPGDAVEPQASVTLTLPAGTKATNADQNGVIGANGVTWEIRSLAPGASQKVRALLVTPTAGKVPFHCTATGTAGESAQSDCETAMFDVHSVLVEVVDLTDPVPVGDDVNYVIKITNQSDAVDTNLRLVCTVPDSQEFITGTGVTPVRTNGKTITMDIVPSLDPKAVATWQILTKALSVDDSRFKVEVSGDQFEEPIHREESTHLY